MVARESGRLIIISGPSGAGKSTVVHGLLEACPLPLQLSVSATTRPPRDGEVDGVDYHFLSEAEFERRRLAGAFLEACQVFGRHWYGTLRETVSSGLKSGQWLILEIDVEGANHVLQEYPDAQSIFIHPGDDAELERRLRGRETESEEDIQRRLTEAKRELKHAPDYRLVVVNDQLPSTIEAVCRYLCELENQKCSIN